VHDHYFTLRHSFITLVRTSEPRPANQMFNRLKLSHWGYLLVGVPSVLMLFFILAFSLLLERSDQEALQQAYAKDVAVQASLFSQSYIDAAYAFATYATKHDEQTQNHFNRQLAKLADELHLLKKIVEQHPEQLQHLKGVESTTKEGLDLLASGRLSVENGGTHETNRLKLSIAASGKRLTDELSSLMKEARTVHSQGPQETINTRELIGNLLKVLFVVVIVTAFVLVHLFNRGMTTRFSILMDNTSRLASHKELNAPLTGSDEIATLDSTFHGMASAMAELERLKREFTAMVSHDLRTPLTSLYSLLTFLEEGLLGTLNEKGGKSIKTAKRELDRLMSLINELLELEKLKAGKLGMDCDAVSLLEVVEQAVASVEALASKQSVQVVNQVEEVDVWIDEGRIVQVLVNLLSNAVKFSPSNTCITITAACTGELVEVQVQDQGRGIPTEACESIFEPFKQVRKSDQTEKKGFGLGLAICKTVIEEHGGKIGVRSTVGNGATFWFTIPTAESVITKEQRWDKKP
jgi:signal transduction histidine kinase